MLEKLKSNLAAIQQRIEAAAKSSGRSGSDVKLVAVTKYVDAEATRQIVNAGCRMLGENRPQALWEKAEALDGLDAEWHLIGHLQRNKVKRTLPLVNLIHSVDSLRLLNAIDSTSKELELTTNVLLEVNVSGEAAKHGFVDSELPAALDHVAQLDHIAVRGLMCMAGLEGDADDARREFASLRELAEAHRDREQDHLKLSELSMGMSGDFEIAIEEGATLIRVGSALLEGIK